ncbi:lamin-A-like [Mugil cephalus]|uniref:lamin-A-like n=1 Tax=Mugil cephalus TaxID=48193 RepID=UPI001FB860CA|nr:lamin-A-like [Mugil cephalus]
MEEIKDESEKNKAAASRSIRPFRPTEPYNNQKELESLKKEKLKEKEKKRERAEKEVETLKRKLETENSSSSDSQETLRGIDVVVNDGYRFISLRNMSDQDKPLGGRQLKVQINNSEPITYTFDPSVKLKAGKSVALCRPGFAVPSLDTSYLVWMDLKSWKSGDRVQVSLQ